MYVFEYFSGFMPLFPIFSRLEISETYVAVVLIGVAALLDEKEKLFNA
jgi:hypothetical protein